MAMLLNVVETYVHCIHIAIYSSSIITYVTRGFSKYLWTLSSVMQQPADVLLFSGECYMNKACGKRLHLFACVCIMPSKSCICPIFICFCYISLYQVDWAMVKQNQPHYITVSGDIEFITLNVM